MNLFPGTAHTVTSEMFLCAALKSDDAALIEQSLNTGTRAESDPAEYNMMLI